MFSKSAQVAREACCESWEDPPLKPESAWVAGDAWRNHSSYNTNSFVGDSCCGIAQSCTVSKSSKSARFFGYHW